jgi:PAS domain S-box-containing protein
MIKVLYIEDDPAHYELTNRSLESSEARFDLQTASTIADAFHLLRIKEYDVVLSDYRLPDGSGMDVISRLLEQNISTAVVLITNQEDINVAIAALKAGAVDYVVKQSDYLHKLPIVLNNAYKHSQLEKQKKALREAENKFRNIFDNAVEGIFQSSLEGRFISVNPAMAKIYGYISPDDMVNSVTNISEQIYTNIEDRGKFIGSLNAQGFIKNFEGENLRKDGSIIWTSTNARAVKDDIGNTVFVEGFLKDITDRKEAERILQRQVQALTVLHAASVASIQSNNQDEMIEQVTRITASIYTEVCGVLLLNDQSDRLTPHSSYCGANLRNWQDSYPIAEGITGKAVTAGKAIRINNVSEDPSYIQTASGIRSELCVPLRVQNHIIGVFNVESQRANAFDEEDEQILNTIAGGLGAAIEKLQLFETEQAQHQRETAMLDLLRAAASSLDLNQVLQSILDQLVKIIPSDGGTVQLLDGDQLNILATFGNEAANYPTHSPLKLSRYPLNQYIVTEKRTVRIDNTLTDERYLYLDKFANVKSFLGIPLIAKNRTIGVVTLESHQTQRFSREDEELGLTIANYTSVAIENARSFDVEQRRRMQAEILHRATEALTTSIELDKLFEIIFDSLLELISYDSASIEIIGQDDYYEIVAGRNISFELTGKKYAPDLKKWGGIENAHKPRIIADVQADPRFEKFKGSEYIRSWMGIPLFSQGKLIGYLNLDSKKNGFFKEEHIAVLQTFANQIGIVLENARLFQEKSHRSHIIEALAEIANEIATLQEVVPALDIIATRTLSLLNASSVAIYLLQDDKEIIKIVSAKGAYQKELISHTIRRGEGITGNVIASGKPEIVDEIAKDSRKLNVPGTPEEDSSFETMMSAPLILHGESIGAINAWRLKSKGLFDKSELNFLVNIAHQASISIDSGNLFQESIRRTQEAAAIAEVGRDISATLQLDIVLERIAMYARILLKADTSAVYLSEPDHPLLTAIAAIGAESEEIKNDPIETGVGILGSIALRKSGEIVNNTMADPRTIIIKGTQVVQHEHIMAASVLSKDNLTGLLVVWRNGVEKEFKVTELGFLSSLAQQAAVAIENARLFDAERRRRQEAENLRSAAVAITSSLDPKTVLQTILTTLQQVVPFDSGTMMFLEDDVVRIVAAQGFDNMDAILNRTFSAENKLIHVINQLKKPYIIDDVTDDARFERWGGEDPVHAWMGIPLIAHDKIIGYITLDSLKAGAFDQNAATLAHTFALHATAAIENTQLFENLQTSNQELSLAYDTTLAGWAKALELRDKETHGHTNRVTDLTMELARFIGLPKADLIPLRRGVLLHDIGKMGVPDEILHKDGPLTEKEWIEMHKHPQYAFDLLYPILFLRPSIDIPYSHHEWWDGSGYPQKLKGAEIPLPARIFAIVDVWDALLSDRPYRKAWTKAKAAKYLREQAGSHFDPNLVETFLNMINKKVEKRLKADKQKTRSKKTVRPSKSKKKA